MSALLGLARSITGSYFVNKGGAEFGVQRAARVVTVNYLPPGNLYFGVGARLVRRCS